MKVPLLKKAIDAYQYEIKKSRQLPYAYWWAICQNFQHHWDLEAPDLATMFDKSFDSQISRRWWHAENYEPKKMMGIFIQLNSDFVRAAFKNLLDEEISLDIRFSKFKTHCDTLYEAYRESQVHVLHGSHYQTEQTIWLYLSLAYPDRYAYHNPQSFKVFLKEMGAQKPLEAYEYERSRNLQKTLYTFLKKEENLIAEITKRLPETDFDPDSYLLVTHFLRLWSDTNR